MVAERESPPPRHLVVPPQGVVFAGTWLPRKESPRTTQGPNAHGPGPEQWVPGASGSSVSVPLRFLEKSPSTHLYTETLSSSNI